MKIKRQLTWDLYFANFCPVCACARDFKRIGGFPGITTEQCSACGVTLTINLLEDSQDQIDIPVEFEKGIETWMKQYDTKKESGLVSL
jgi:hypothetical protein